MIYTVYKITNLINNKVYIGQTSKSIDARFNRHWKEKNSYDRYLHRALRKYNKCDFKIETLANAFNKEDLNYLECYFIAFYKSNNSKYGYNLTVGGDGGLRSPEVIKKATAKLKGKKRPKSVCDKISKKLKGRKMTDEQIKKSVKNRRLKSGYINKNKTPVSIKTPDNLIFNFKSIEEANQNLPISKGSIFNLVHGIRNEVKGYKLSNNSEIRLEGEL